MTHYDSDDDLHAALENAGALWRAQQPPAPSVHLPARTDQRPSPFFFALLSATVAFGFLGLLVASRIPADLGAGSQASLGVMPSADQEAALVRNGDRVTASGQVFLGSGSDTPVLCRFGPTRLRYDPAYSPTCFSASVALAGLDANELPGWRRVPSGAWVSSPVLVTGIWHVSGLEVSQVAPSEAAPAFPELPTTIPCPPPDSGWRESGDVDAIEAATARLEAEIAAHPNLYGGSWWAAGDSANEGAEVVSTTGDTTSVRAALEEIYPFNLCVVGAQYSRAQLDATAATVAALNDSWRTTVWPPLGKVLVQVAVADEMTTEALAKFGDEIEIDALVNRAK